MRALTGIARRLEAGDQDAAFAAWQAFAQVILDPSGLAHAAGRNDYRVAALAIG